MLQIESLKYNDLVATKEDRDPDHFRVIKVPLDNVIFKEEKPLSAALFKIVRERVILYYNIVKAVVSSFSTFFVLYVFEIEPTIEIPLLNADFFDRCLMVVTRHSTKRNPTEPAAMIRVYNLYRTYLNPAFLAHYDRVITRDGMAHVNNEIRNELVTSTKNHLALNYPRAVAKRIRLNYYLENLRIKKENAKRTQKVEFFSKENISDAVNDHFKSDEYKNMFNSRTVDKIKFGYRNNIQDQRALLEDFYACQRMFEAYIGEFEFDVVEPHIASQFAEIYNNIL